MGHLSSHLTELKPPAVEEPGLGHLVRETPHIIWAPKNNELGAEHRQGMWTRWQEMRAKTSEALKHQVGPSSECRVCRPGDGVQLHLPSRCKALGPIPSTI